ncbi:MAG: class I SAM-dependent methyltransferase [Anaerolineales bacterium]|nr:class I SAM-dependent methyltransferase [Anaerolineales bacterium]
MDPREYELMYRVEDRHWWYRGMSAATRALIERWTFAKDLRIFDAGCGTGAALTHYLPDYGTPFGADLYAEALHFCRQRNAPRLTRASILDLPFASASFDLVVSFDVLYERGVADELSALREFFRVLAPNGRVLLRLPAYDWLRGKHDERVHTHRRYTTRLVAELLRQSGFRVLRLSYANMFLFPFAALKRLSERLFPPDENYSDLSLNVGAFNSVLQWILASEAPLVARFGLPFGLSVVAVGAK